MKILLFLVILFLILNFCSGQNVGIGISTPTNPLSFPATTAKKISLYPGENGDVGFAVGGNLLKIYADHASADIAFGYDNYIGGFTERVRIGGNGNVGIGTSTASQKLEVIGAGINKIIIGSTSAFGSTGFELRSDYGTSSEWRPGYVLSADQGLFTGRLDFFTNGSGSANKFGNVLGMSIINGKVGIGFNNPTNALSFPATIEKKISLFPGNTGDAGLAVSPSLLKVYSDHNNADIAFGYDDYVGGFTERMRIKGNGNVGIGTSNPTRKLQVDGISYLNDFVGIQNSNPTAPLTFAASLGKKIILYPGANGDAGFGIVSNRLQIFSDNPNADIAFGYDVAGSFNEKFAIKPNGALAVNGSMGTAGQLLQSNGNGDAATWANKPSVLLYNMPSPSINLGNDPSELSEFIPGLNDQYFTLQQNSRIMILGTFFVIGSGDIYAEILLEDVSNNVVARCNSHAYLHSSSLDNINTIGIGILPIGTYHTRVTINRITTTAGSAFVMPTNHIGYQGTQLFLQILPD